MIDTHSHFTFHSYLFMMFAFFIREQAGCKNVQAIIIKCRGFNRNVQTFSSKREGVFKIREGESTEGYRHKKSG